MNKGPANPRTLHQPNPPKAPRLPLGKGVAERGARKTVAAKMGRIVHRYQGK